MKSNIIDTNETRKNDSISVDYHFTKLDRNDIYVTNLGRKCGNTQALNIGNVTFYFETKKQIKEVANEILRSL